MSHTEGFVFPAYADFTENRLIPWLYISHLAQEVRIMLNDHGPYIFIRNKDERSTQMQTVSVIKPLFILLSVKMLLKQFL